MPQKINVMGSKLNTSFDVFEYKNVNSEAYDVF